MSGFIRTFTLAAYMLAIIECYKVKIATGGVFEIVVC